MKVIWCSSVVVVNSPLGKTKERFKKETPYDKRALGGQVDKSSTMWPAAG